MNEIQSATTSAGDRCDHAVPRRASDSLATTRMGRQVELTRNAGLADERSSRLCQRGF